MPLPFLVLVLEENEETDDRGGAISMVLRCRSATMIAFLYTVSCDSVTGSALEDEGESFLLGDSDDDDKVDEEVDDGREVSVLSTVVL